MATVNIEVKGTVGVSRLLVPKVLNPQNNSAVYSVSIENPQFAPARGTDPVTAQPVIQILQDKFVQPGNQQYPSPVFWANLPAKTAKGKENHVNYWDKATQAQVPVEHDIGRNQPITAIVQVYDSTNPIAVAKHAGKVAHLTDIMFDDVKTVSWYIPGSAAGSVFAGFKPLSNDQSFKPADQGSAAAPAPSGTPTTPNPAEAAPFTDATVKRDPFNGNPAGGAANPTVANPTVANPTVANPTAANPTATNPTAANPTAVNPTAVNPTAVNPTVANPTIANPTVANPTVANPAAVNPAAVNPAAVNPAAVNPANAGVPFSNGQAGQVGQPGVEDPTHPNPFK